MTVTHVMPEPPVVRYRTRVPAFVDTSLRKIDRLSSGCKLDRSTVSSSSGQGDTLRRQLASLDSALRVSSEAFTISGIAEGALGEMTTVLRDIRTAVLDAAGSAARGMASPGQPEVDAAIARLDDIVRTTTWSGQTIFDGSRSLDYSESTIDGNAADLPLLDSDHTRIDHVHNPNNAVVTVAFTPASAVPDAPEAHAEVSLEAPPVAAAAVVTIPGSAEAVTTTQPEGADHVAATPSATEPTMPDAPVSADPSNTAAPVSAGTAPVSEPVPSDPARRAVLEADNAQPGTDVNGAAVTAAQEFVVTGSGGSRLFAFPTGATLGEMADSINAVAESTGVTATLVFASDVRVDSAVPARSNAGDGPVALETVFPVHGEDENRTKGAGETSATSGATGTGHVNAAAHDSDENAAPDAEAATAAPATEDPDAAAAVTAPGDLAEHSADNGVVADDGVRERPDVPAVPEVSVSPDIIRSLIPGLNCDPDGRLYAQAGSEAGTFTIYADKDLTRAVGEVRDGVFTPAEGASFPDLDADALIIGSAAGSPADPVSGSGTVPEGDVFVLAFAGIGLANDHDVTLSGDTGWFVPEQSLVNGVRLQDNTSRDGELHFRYTPLTVREDGTVASFQIDAYTDTEFSDQSRAATSGPVSVDVTSSEDSSVFPSGFPADFGTVASSDPVVVSGAETPSEPLAEAASATTVTDAIPATPATAPTAPMTSKTPTESAHQATGPDGESNTSSLAASAAPSEAPVETVHLSPVSSPDGTDSGLYVALAIPVDNLPPEPATATAAFTNLGLRLTSGEYGSDAAVSVQNRAGRLFRHPDDSHAVVAPGESVHVSGADATVVINGQPVRTHGLTASVHTAEVTGSFAFSEGEPGNATIAVVGYETGSVAAAAGRLAPEPPPAVRHEPAAAVVTVGSAEPGATDGLRDADGNLVPVELDFTRLEPAADPEATSPVSKNAASPVVSSTTPEAAAMIADAEPIVVSAGSGRPDPVSSVTPVSGNPAKTPTSVPAAASVAVQPEPIPADTVDTAEPDSLPAASVPAPASPPVSSDAAAPAAKNHEPVTDAHTDGVVPSPSAETKPSIGVMSPSPATASEPAVDSAASAAVPDAVAVPSLSETVSKAASPSGGQSDAVSSNASTAEAPHTAAATDAVSEGVVPQAQSGSAEQPAEIDPTQPLGPLRIASVTTPKSVSVEYVGEGTLKITCVTRDTTGKQVSKTVVTEKVRPENLRAGYYITHPGLRGLFIKTAGKISLEESHDPAVSTPVDVTEKSLLPLEGGTTAATHPHQTRRDKLHSFSGGVPVAGEDDAVYAIQSLEMDKIGRVTFGGKDYSLADVKLGGAANLAGNSLLTLQILAEATDDIAALRDRLGAFKANMLEHNIRSLDVAVENIAVTEHAIHDSRSAEERVSFTRGMMLDQSGTSILAQANQKSQNVISLLQ